MRIPVTTFRAAARRAASPRACLAAAGAASALLAGACSATTQQSITVTPAALVSQSAHTTLSQRTADITLTGSVSAAGQQIPLHGSGAADFASHTMSLDLSTNVSGTSVTMKELLVSGQVYMSGNFSGASFKDLTGKDWISLPLAASAQGLYGSDPFAQLTVLEQQGAAVTPLGQKTLGGRQVTGYSIVPTKASMLKAAQDELAQLALDPNTASQIQKVLQQAQPPTITVWFDSSHLLRQMSMNLDMGELAAGGAAALEMNVDHYGVALDIKPPPPSDVVSFQQFLQDAGSAGSGTS